MIVEKEDMEIYTDIPENILKFISEHNGVNLAININRADCDDGYAHIIHHSIVISQLTRTCHHCGYDQLWAPDDTNSRCQRHQYGSWRYDVVFMWTKEGNWRTLEECFEEWLELNRDTYKPCIKKEYGRFGWA